MSPVSRFTFTLAKLLPYWAIGFVVLNLCMLLAWLVYGLTPAGNVLTIYLATLIFALVMSGLGLVISNYSSTMQQAMFVMWFCMLIFILMSGLFTPISSMPEWAQGITYLNPLRYFMEIMRMVYLKGSGICDIGFQLSVLSSFALLLYAWPYAATASSNNPKRACHLTSTRTCGALITFVSRSRHLRCQYLVTYVSRYLHQEISSKMPFS